MNTARKQQGVALVVSLILLVVMTLLGASALNSALLQTRMSEGYQSQSQALGRAENTLVHAEQELLTLLNGEIKPDHYYFLHGNAELTPPDVLRIEWDFDYAHDREAGYLLEYIGPRKVPGESMADGYSIAGSEIHLHRVSARAAGPRGALRTVQSIYGTFEAP
ncbi:pilus assembly PilX family protein [Thioalkalivibrio thiocyanodenitrificans]|uniref:pilus assembly PilX family protein n=1 Tax=Thioalkalivibrio thiocyanodenitrificans TaxID=243063 RepID=UPI00036E148B|nr:PilX N-terminal domain-containing pilus assembly protein [Thioalkalivibrio thiocyanodenitrificans]